MNQLDVYIIVALLIILLAHVGFSLFLATRCRQTVGSSFSVIFRLVLFTPVVRVFPESARDTILKILCIQERQFWRAMHDLRRCSNIHGD